MQPQSEAFDAIVVGSGISGGWAAKELTERGLRVLLLERGKDVEHVKDYPNARKAPWEYPHRGGRTHAMEEAYPVLKRDYPLNEKNLEWWANEKDSPYTEVKRFDWYRGYHVGGRSLTWGRQSYRLSDLDFEANAKEGIAIDWPIRYADLAPWYDHVERFAGVAGSVEGLPQLPDGQFQPAMPLNVAEERIAARLAKQFGGRRRLIPGRVANLTRPLPGRGRCQYRNACWLGCPYGAYFSTQSSTLPAAAATGRLTLKTFQIVTDVVYDAGRKRATGVRAIDAGTGASTVYSAKVVFVCASTINSTWLLMRSARDVWPGGLGSSSGELGHNLMDHHFRLGANGTIDDLEDRNVIGRRPTGFYIPRYRNFFGDKRGYLRGFGYQGSASREGWQRAVAELGVGGAFKDEMATPGAWQMGATAFGEMLPNHANRITIDATRTGQMGAARGRDRLRHRRKRAPDADRHDERHGRNARGDRRQGRARLRQHLVPGHGHPRNGDGANGPRPEDVGAERAQPGVGLHERLRHRWFGHGFVGMPEPVPHLHGAHRPRGGVRRRRAQARQPVRGRTRWTIAQPSV